MTEPQVKKISTPKETRSRLMLWMRVLGVALAVLLLVRVGWGVLAARDVRATIDQAREAGHVLSMDEMPPPDLAAEDDAWPLYAALLARADALHIGVPMEVELNRQRGLLTEVQRARLDADRADQQLLGEWLTADERSPALARTVGERLATLAPLLEGLEQATARPGIAWPRGTDDPLMPVDADLAPLPPLLHFTMARALLDYDAGDHDRALAWLGVALRLGEHFAAMPTLEGWLIEGDTVQFTNEMLQRMLPGLDASPRARAALVEALARTPSPAAFARSARFSQARVHEIYQAMAQRRLTFDGEPDTGGLHAGLKHWALRPFLDANAAHTLRAYARILPMLDSPYAEATDELDAFTEAIGRETAGFGAMARRQARAEMSHLLTTHRRVTVAHAQRHMAAMALALRTYEIEHGQRPDALDALVPAYLPALPEDPITGQAYRYLPDDPRPRLYSIGFDRIDHAGDYHPRDPGGAHGHDVCFFLDGPPPTEPLLAEPPQAREPAEGSATEPSDEPTDGPGDEQTQDPPQAPADEPA